MSTFGVWDEDDPQEVENYENIRDGLSLLGWFPDMRLTTEESFIVSEIALEARQLSVDGKLGDKERETYAQQVYELAYYRLVWPDVRARTIAGSYVRSYNILRVLSLIEQGSLCFYRGYFTAALALLFIALERYLRFVSGWSPGDRDPTFKDLRASIEAFTESESKEEARMLLESLYSRYDAQSPTLFYFNRHGLLHGLRDPLPKFDEMNCARVLYLFDALAGAEVPNPSDSIVMFPDEQINRLRYHSYSGCQISKPEMKLLISSEEMTRGSLGRKVNLG